MGGATMLLRVLSIVSGIILARLLDPGDFGVLAMAGIVLSTTSLFSGLGMNMAVIQRQEDRRQLAYQGFVVTLLSGVVLQIVVVIGAPWFALLLGSKDVVPVLRWMSFLILLGSLVSVPEGLLQKDLRFGRQSLALVLAEMLNLGLSIALAMMGYGLWALVFGPLAKALLYLMLIWGLCPGWDWLLPRPWDRKLMKDMLSFGSQTTGGGLVSFFYSIVDNLIVGATMGKVPLGFYSKAYDFSLRTVDGIINFIGVVLFPSYAQLQEDKERLARAYFKSLRFLSFFTVPIALGMFVTAPELITILIGQKWAPMIGAFQILAFVGVVKPLSGTTGALFASTGHPGYNLRAAILLTFVMVPLIVLFLHLGYGIEGVAVAVLSSHVVGFTFNVYQLHLLLPGKARGMIVALLPALGCGMFMVAVVLLIKPLLLIMGNGQQTVGTLLAMVAVGAVVYCVPLIWVQKPLVTEVASIAFKRFRSQES